MTNLTPHASFENNTDIVRWSVDLRYQDAEIPNNIDEDPADFDPERDPVTMACWPGEGDFVIKDAQNPAARSHRYRQIQGNPHPLRTDLASTIPAAAGPLLPSAVRN